MRKLKHWEESVQRLQRPDLIYASNSSIYRTGLVSLMKEHRDMNDINKLASLLRMHSFFNGHSNEFLLQCCKVIRFEKLDRKQLVYQKGMNFNKLIISVIGDLRVTIRDIDVTMISHFGAALMMVGSEAYSGIPDLQIFANTECQVAVIDKQHFGPSLMTEELSRSTREMTQLFKFQIFSQLTYTQIRRYYINSFKKSFNCLDVVYAQNSEANLVYLVINGIFETRRDANGAVQSCKIVTPGQFLGEQEIIEENPLRPQTAFCISDEGEVLIFEKNYFLDYMHDSLGVKQQPIHVENQEQLFRKTKQMQTLSKLVKSQLKMNPNPNQTSQNYFKKYKSMKKSPSKYFPQKFSRHDPPGSISVSRRHSMHQQIINEFSDEHIQVQNPFKNEKLRLTQYKVIEVPLEKVGSVPVIKLQKQQQQLFRAKSISQIISFKSLHQLIPS